MTRAQDIFDVTTGLATDVTDVINVVVIVVAAIVFISALRKGTTWPVVISAALFAGTLIFAATNPDVLGDWVSAIFPEAATPAEPPAVEGAAAPAPVVG
jgi:chromate transport protein ChrA